MTNILLSHDRMALFKANETKLIAITHTVLLMNFNWGRLQGQSSTQKHSWGTAQATISL